MVYTEKKSGGAAFEKIQSRGKLIVATPGDYCPMAYSSDLLNGYQGFDIELAWRLAARLGVKVDFVPTSWASLADDAKLSRFDMAVGGISRTAERAQKMTLSAGYLSVGKTILCRKGEEERFQSLADVDQPDVRVMYNPGGTNEDFVESHFKQAKIRLAADNALIPARIAENEANVMITETVEAAFYVKEDPRLAAPLLASPFTKDEFCIVLSEDCAPLVDKVNEILQGFRTDGTLEHLCRDYLGSLAGAQNA
ncbi:transporter substrate-binding domain-containing protein [Mitsuokella sp.]|uniref:transporter substrate-binding domain-containing protein n=1 Tax=Mitsuokella sp. TaxID=2049034 RepID=UPI003D7EC213